MLLGSAMGRIVLVVLLALHGLVHLIGVGRAFDLASFPLLRDPISRPAGLLWLAAALALVTSAVLRLGSSTVWWAPGLAGIVLSQVAIFTAFHDARAGTIVNLVLAVPLAIAALDAHGSSLRSRYHHEASGLVAAAPTAPLAPVTEADLEKLPPVVATYLRRAGVVGRPPTQTLFMRYRGALRSSPDAPWMHVEGTQVNTFGDSPSRVFYADGAMYGVPFFAFHRFVGDAATMEVRAASFVTVVDARGPEMNQSETVTVLNDMCWLAPSALLGPHVRFEPTADPRAVRVFFERRGITVSAELLFDELGDLALFTSEDRYLSADGKTFAKHPWVTPFADYTEMDGLRLARRGEAIWKGAGPRGEDHTYARFELVEVRQVAPLPTMARTFAMASGKPAGLARSFTYR